MNPFQMIWDGLISTIQEEEEAALNKLIEKDKEEEKKTEEELENERIAQAYAQQENDALVSAEQLMRNMAQPIQHAKIGAIISKFRR